MKGLPLFRAGLLVLAFHIALAMNIASLAVYLVLGLLLGISLQSLVFAR